MPDKKLKQDFTVRLPLELHQWLRMEYARTGESMSKIAVKALRDYKERKETERAK